MSTQATLSVQSILLGSGLFLKVCINIMFNVILIALEHCSRSFNYAMGRESQKQEKIYELSNFTENIIFKSMTIIACMIHFFF